MAADSETAPGSNGPLSTAAVTPEKGAVTWDSEGSEGGRYHSRKLHVPTDSSGLTIGRGYDMKQKNAGTIVNDLTKANVCKEDAEKISKAAGLTGDDARQFIKDQKLGDFEISQPSQKLLFAATYDAEESEAKRLATKVDVTAKYGTTDWDGLDPSITEILVDLKFRGDYDGVAREKIQKSVVDNDIEAFAANLCNRDNWKNVPEDRFKRRKAFLEKALDDRMKADKITASVTVSAKPLPPKIGAPTPVIVPALR